MLSSFSGIGMHKAPLCIYDCLFSQQLPQVFAKLRKPLITAPRREIEAVEMFWVGGRGVAV